jgi:hypothetical protein
MQQRLTVNEGWRCKGKVRQVFEHLREVKVG